MPIYAYSCRACGHSLEALQKISEAPLTDCPNCGKPELRKELTAAAFRLKGSGWYETDFKNSGKKDVAKDTKSSGSDSDSSTATGSKETKTETAPAGATSSSTSTGTSGTN